MQLTETPRSQMVPELSEAELHRILVNWNNTSDASLLGHSLHRCFEVQSMRSPYTPAVVAGTEEVSYAELDRRANQLAHQLREYGVSSAVPVGIYVTRSLNLAVSILAVLKAGGVCVPLDTSYPAERLAFMLEDTGAPVVIRDSELPPALRDRRAQDVVLAECDPALSQSNCAAPEIEVSGDDPAFILYTSGSTGRPKGVLLTHSGLANYNLAAAKMYGVGSADRVLQFSSPSFDIFLEEIFTTWFGGGTLVLRSPEMSYSVAAFLEGIRQTEITVVDLPDHLLARVGESDGTTRGLYTLECATGDCRWRKGLKRGVREVVQIRRTQRTMG